PGARSALQGLHDGGVEDARGRALRASRAPEHPVLPGHGRGGARDRRRLKPRKMNYEALGNTVGHLHWHLFPRYEWDPHPKRPIWETSHSPRLPGPEEYADTLAAIRRHLA